MQPDPTAREPSFIETARRAQIVEATIATIAEEGLARTSFARIARRAAISPGLISYHFLSKDEVIKAVLQLGEERMDRAMSGGSGAATSYVDGLRRILVGYVGHCAAHPAEVLAVRAIRESATSSAVQRAKAADHRVGMAELVAFLKEGQEHGEFRDFDPEVFTSTLFAAMRDVPAQLEGLSQQQGTEFAAHWSAIFIHAAADQHQDEENR